MIYAFNVMVTAMLIVIVGATILVMLAARNDRRRSDQEHELAKYTAEQQAKVTEVQRQILAKHYRPEMEIIFGEAILHDHNDPAYLEKLEAFRNDYPEAHQLWVRHRGLDATLDSHVRSNQTSGFIES